MPVPLGEWVLAWGLMFCLELLPAAVLSYFCGCFNGAVIVSKYLLRDDVRSHGSGNAGLTNFYRTFGGPLTLAVISCDVLKMIAAVELVSCIWGGGAPVWKYWAGVFCLFGHVFPCMFRFQGGKGILSGGTLAILIDWRVALVVWGGFLILVLLTRYVSLGSLWAGASFPFISWYCYPQPLLVILAFITGWLVVWRHQENLKRLLRGTENKFSFHHKEGGKESRKERP